MRGYCDKFAAKTKYLCPAYEITKHKFDATHTEKRREWETERVSGKDKLDADEQRKYSATVVVGGDGLPLLFLLLLFFGVRYWRNFVCWHI